MAHTIYTDFARFLIGNLLSGDASHDAIHYVLLRAAHLFHDRHARFPGAFSSELEGDIGPYKRCVHEAAAHMGITVLPCDDLIHEMCRYGGAEMHAVAAVMGGIASQEAIKVITRQFVPVSNAFIFNGAKGTAAAIEL